MSSAATNDDLSTFEERVRRHVRRERQAHRVEELAEVPKLSEEEFRAILPQLTPEHYQEIVEERAVFVLDQVIKNRKVTGVSGTCGYLLCDSILAKSLRSPTSPKYHISLKNRKVYDVTDRQNYCSDCCYEASEHVKAQISTEPLWMRNTSDVTSANVTFLDRDKSKGRSGRVVVPLAPCHKIENEQNDADSLEENDVGERGDDDDALAEKIMQHLKINAVDDINVEPKEVEVAVKESAHCVTAISSADSLPSPTTVTSEKCNTSPSPTQASLFDEVKTFLMQWSTEETHHLLHCHISRDDVDETKETVNSPPQEDDVYSRRVAQFYGIAPMENAAPKSDESAADNMANDVTFAPRVDSKAQKSARIQLVLQRLTRPLQDVTRDLGLTLGSIASPLRRLVSTLNLKSNNVTLRAPQWVLVAHVVLQLLRTFDSDLDTKLNSATEFRNLNRSGFTMEQVQQLCSLF